MRVGPNRSTCVARALVRVVYTVIVRVVLRTLVLVVPHFRSRLTSSLPHSRSRRSFCVASLVARFALFVPVLTSFLRLSLHLSSSFRLSYRDHFVHAYVRCICCFACVVVPFVIHTSSFSRIAVRS